VRALRLSFLLPLAGAFLVACPAPDDTDTDLVADTDTDTDPPPPAEPMEVACDGAWDVVLGFGGRDFYLRTSSGPSGSGAGGVGGPWPWAAASALTAPTVDPAGAPVRFASDDSVSLFADWSWYAYGVDPTGPGGPHTLSPNFRVYLIDPDGRAGEATRYALQIVDYYASGTSATYDVRWRALDSDVVQRATVDATSTTAWALLDLSTGVTTAATEAEKRASSSWHLAFRRENVRSNGGSSGPGAVTVGLADAQDAFYDDAGEPIPEVFRDADPDAELAALTGPIAEPPRGRGDVADRIRSGFGDTWASYDGASGNYAANAGVGYVVRGADGERFGRFRFAALDFPTREGAGVKSFTFEIEPYLSDEAAFGPVVALTGDIPSGGGARCFTVGGR
jgi:hypothetical protein